MSAQKLLAGGTLSSGGSASTADTFTANTLTFATSINSIPAANFAYLSGATSSVQDQITAFGPQLTFLNVATTNLQSQMSSVGTQISVLAPKASPIFTGTLTSTSLTVLTKSTTISALAVVGEMVSLPTFATSITTTYGTSTNVNYIASVSAPITTLLITSLPTTAQRAYTFTYVLATTSGANYITGAVSFQINGSTTTFTNGITGLSPTAYIVQTVSIINIGTTDGTPSWKVFSTAYSV